MKKNLISRFLGVVLALISGSSFCQADSPDPQGWVPYIGVLTGVSFISGKDYDHLKAHGVPSEQMIQGEHFAHKRFGLGGYIGAMYVTSFLVFACEVNGLYKNYARKKSAPIPHAPAEYYRRSWESRYTFGGDVRLGLRAWGYIPYVSLGFLYAPFKGHWDHNGEIRRTFKQSKWVPTISVGIEKHLGIFALRVSYAETFHGRLSKVFEISPRETAHQLSKPFHDRRVMGGISFYL